MYQIWEVVMGLFFLLLLTVVVVFTAAVVMAPDVMLSTNACTAARDSGEILFREPLGSSLNEPCVIALAAAAAKMFPKAVTMCFIRSKVVPASTCPAMACALMKVPT